jgi:nitrogen fixation protein FixH
MTGKGWYWPLVIVGLLLGSIVANLGLMVLASNDRSFAVEKDYYRKALAWDETMAQERRNAELGWSLEATLAPAAGSTHHARLDVTVRDASARPIEGARVTVEALQSARASQVFPATLSPRGDGRYAATLPSSRHGLWELRFRIERGGDIFTAVVARDLDERS